jgi:arylsulfatase A-like enzyme
MKINSKYLIRGMAGILLFLFPLICFSQQKPNILFIFSDDHTWQSIGAYQGLLKDVAVTPNIDKLASEGMRFNNCYVTNSLCGPSRAAILTGKYGHKNGITENRMTFDGSQQTFPKLMQQNGYQTAIIGKWHLGSDPTGFDYWDVMQGQGQYYNPFLITGDINGRKSTRTVTGYNSNIVADLSIDWLENGRDKSKPFILMSQFKATHHGWAPGPEEYDLYDGVTIPEPSNLFDDYSNRGTAIQEQKMNLYEDLRQSLILGNPGELGKLNPEQKTAWDAYRAKNMQVFNQMGIPWDSINNKELSRFKYQALLKNYLACAAGIDRNIGRLRTFLEENDLADNTIVIYMPDQGYFLGEHGFFDKRLMYEQALKTALIVHWPGVVEPGSVNDSDIVSNLDIAETFLDIAGIVIPEDMQGRSLVPVLRGNTPADWRKTFLYQYFELRNHNIHPHYGVTTGRYKLIYFHTKNEWEFYDLKKDPQEMINQYYIPENDSIIAALKQELVRLRTQYDSGEGPDLNNEGVWPFEKWTEPL